jgi:hypothetical protein
MATIQRVVPFSPRDVAHFNVLRNALVNVLGIAADDQAYVQVIQLLFGSGLASITKDGSNNMVLSDPVAGSKTLSALGGAAVAAVPPLLGYPFDGSSGHMAAANDVGLIAVVVNGALTLTDMQVDCITTSGENLQLGIYDNAGNLLRKTAVVVNSVSGLRKIALSSSLSLVSGRFYLAISASGTAGLWRSNRLIALVSAADAMIYRRVTRGSWAELPNTIAIPTSVYTSGGPGPQGVVTGGLY